MNASNPLVLYSLLALAGGCSSSSGGGDGDADTDGDSDSDSDSLDCIDIDRDDDDHAAIGCGGDDCDDDDALVRPGADDGALADDVVQSVATSSRVVAHVDPTGTASVLWAADQPFGRRDLVRAFGAPGAWETEAIDGPFSPRGVAMADGPGGELYLANGFNSGGDFRIARRVAAGWEAVRLFGSRGAVERIDLVAAADGWIHAGVGVVGDSVYWAATNGTDVGLEPVASSPIDSGVSIALDAANAPHMTFVVQGQGLVHAVRRGPNDWESETIDESPIVPSGATALAIDAAGTVHVVYAWLGLGEVRHAWRAGGAWEVETIETTSQPVTDVGLAVRADGSLVASYSDGALRLGARDDAGWHLDTVTGGDVVASSLADAADRTAHVAWIQGPPGALDVHFATVTIPDGVDQDCDGAPDFGCHLRDADGDGSASPACGGADCDDADADRRPGNPDVACDGVDQDCDGEDLVDEDGDGSDCEASGGDDCDDGEPTIHPGAVELACDGTDQDCDGEDLVDWDGDGYDCPGSGGDDCNDVADWVHPGAVDDPCDGIDEDCDGADVEDGDGDGHDCLFAGGDDCDDANALVHPGAVEPAPTTEALDVIWSGYSPSVAIADDGSVHVAYHYEGATSELRHATDESGDWEIETLETDTTTGYDPTITAKDDVVHVAYWNVTQQTLRYRRRVGGAWTMETIDSTAAPAGPRSIEVEDDGTVHVLYREYSAAENDLRHATRAAGAWTDESTGGAGIDWATLAMEDDGTLHAVYRYAVFSREYYMTNESGFWGSEEIDFGISPWGGAPGIVVPGGDVHVMFFDDAIVHATPGGADWDVEDIDDIGIYGSMAAAPDGSLAVGYGRDTELWYATNASGVWVNVWIADNGPPDESASTAIAVDAGGVAHIVWGDNGRELWHAKVPTPNGIDDDCDGVIF